MRPPPSSCLCLCLAASLAAAGSSRAAQPAPAPDPEPAESITIFRCVDADGHVSLGSLPCADDAREQVRAMQRPKDGPALMVTPPAPPPPAGEAAPPPQVVVARTPQPMYECVTPDGRRYTSESGEGNPRWVPLWTLGYGGGRGHGGGSDAGSANRALNDYVANRPLGGYVGAPTPRPSPPATDGGHTDRPGRPGHGGRGMGAGTWVSDTCHALPQQEVCARLVDRREAIRKRFFNAQETERNALRTEERGINARLAADCADY